MVRVVLHAPDGGDVRSVELATSDSVLIGRSPDRERLTGRFADLTADDARLYQVPLPSISGNHLHVRSDDDAIRLRDLGSKNGTWLRLPENATVSLEDAESVSLHLAMPVGRSERFEEPTDGRWSGRDDYARAIVSAIETWLAAQQIPARVSTIRRAASGPDSLLGGQIPLAVPEDLVIAPLRTMDARWPELLARLWRYVMRQNDLFVAEEELRQEGMILASPAMRRAHRLVVDAARRGLRVLLMGPSGTGKDGLAQCYHRHSGRSGPFVARNCGMFNKELVRAELFGADRGSFTGSVRTIVGAVERAHGGTLFLDEIGELPTDVQPMLLRFLDRGEYERLGHPGAASTADVRIVCATNKDLRAATQRGEFRADLWFRLSIQVIDVPSLRERPEDVDAYLKQVPGAASRSVYDALTPGARAVLHAHAWDGNFRELMNFAERLPRDLEIDEVTCRRALDQGALTPSRPSLPSPTPAIASDDWPELASVAARAYADDTGQATPASWDDVKEYIEKYLKPLLFATLSGVDAPSRDKLDVRLHADRLSVDRATALKQIERYFDRFTGEST